ncbi:MAG: PAS domain-containing protein, partial [Burkholderiaceae bacterium]
MTAAAEFAPLMHEDATTQRLVRVGGWTVWLLGSTIAVLLLLDRPVPWMHVALNLGAGFMGGASLLAGRWGRKRLAALVLVWGVWCIVSLVATVNGGIRGPNLLNYPVLIVVSGWVLGVRYTPWLVCATGALFLFFIWGDLNGWMPPARYGNRLAYLAYFSGILGLTAAATLLSRRGQVLCRALRLDQVALIAAREAELRKLLRAVEQSPESVVITDLQERIEYVNDAFVRRTG